MYLIIYFAQSYVYFFIFTIFLLIIFNKNKKSPIHIEDFSFKIIIIRGVSLTGMSLWYAMQHRLLPIMMVGKEEELITP